MEEQIEKKRCYSAKKLPSLGETDKNVEVGRR